MEFRLECSTWYLTNEHNNKWEIKLNMRREIPYLQAVMYYFICHNYKHHTLYWQEEVDFIHVSKREQH